MAAGGACRQDDTPCMMRATASRAKAGVEQRGLWHGTARWEAVISGVERRRRPHGADQPARRAGARTARRLCCGNGIPSVVWSRHDPRQVQTSRTPPVCTAAGTSPAPPPGGISWRSIPRAAAPGDAGAIEFTCSEHSDGRPGGAMRRSRLALRPGAERGAPIAGTCIPGPMCIGPGGRWLGGFGMIRWREGGEVRGRKAVRCLAAWAQVGRARPPGLAPRVLST